MKSEKLKFPILLVLSLLRSNQAEAISNDTVEQKYAVVVDCGSSGSRAHIFHWPANASRDEIPYKISQMIDPQTNTILQKRIRPGLSSVRNNPDSASDYMHPIMNFISVHVPSEAQQATPVYFMGTAGLRLLSAEVQQSILDDISSDLTVEFNFTNLHTRVISGSQEGIYQWMSINAYGNRLAPRYNQTKKNFYLTPPSGRRYAVIELGGASAQVAYELTPELNLINNFYLAPHREAKNAYRKFQSRSDIGSNGTVELFSTTFLGLGSDSARKLAVDLLVRDAMRIPTLRPSFSPSMKLAPFFYSIGSTLVIEDPCLPVGAHEVFEKPIDLLYNQTNTIGFTPKSSNQTFYVRVLGKGNYFTCRMLLNRVILLAKQERLNCESQDSACSMALLGTNFVPFQYFQFLGLGELYYSTKEILDAAGKLNIVTVLTRTIQTCATPYETLLRKYPDANRVDSMRVLRECFKATWVLTWLQIGLRMPFNADLETVNSINGKQLDWTFGAMITELAKNPEVKAGKG